VNRHEVEQRLRVLEAKVKFTMHTLALTRKDNKTGKVDSRTFESLFKTVVANDVDTAKVEEVAGNTGDGTGNRQIAPDGQQSGVNPGSEAGPDGFPR